MSPAGRPNWGSIAALSLIAITAVAVMLATVADLKLVAAFVFAFGLLDAWFLWRVMPKLTGGSMRSQLARMNSDAEAADAADDAHWGWQGRDAEAEAGAERRSEP